MVEGKGDLKRDWGFSLYFLNSFAVNDSAADIGLVDYQVGLSKYPCHRSLIAYRKGRRFNLKLREEKQEYYDNWVTMVMSAHAVELDAEFLLG